MTARWAVVATLAVLSAAAQGSSRVLVVVFDDQLSSGALRRLQAAAVTLFTDQFQPGDLGGVVVDGQLISNRLLSDRADLLKAVERAHPRLAMASDLEASAAIPGAVEPSARLAEIGTIETARAALDRKLSSVEALIGSLARVGGEKAVLLLSDGFGGDASMPRVGAIVNTAAHASVRFDVLDESGSDRDAASGLARGTGGLAAHRSSDFAATIARVAAGMKTATAAAPAPPSREVPSLAITESRPPAAAAPSPPGDAPMAAGVVVGSPSVEPGVLHVRPLAESHVMDLAGGDWSDAAARAGWEAYQRGDLESARVALAPIAARPAASSWVEYVLGQSAYGLGQFQEAAVAWERVRQRQPEFEPVYLDLADDYVKLNDRRRAIAVLVEARRRWPKDADVLNDLGVTQAAAGSLDDAIKVFADAIAVAPKETVSYLNLAKALEMRYVKKRRELQLLNWRWVGAAEERDWQEALKNYRRYLDTGGPYGDLAREGIARLEADVPARRRR